MSLVVRDAVLIPVATPGWTRGWLTVDDAGVITGLGEGEPPPVPGDVLDVGGAIVAPGFVSAHSHLFTSGLRGISPNAPLYPWVASMMEVLAHCDAEDIYWCTLHGALDFLANGVTTAYDFTQTRYSWIYDPAAARARIGSVRPPEFVARQFDGAADAGLRTVSAIRLDDEAAPADETLAVFRDLVGAAGARGTSLGASVFGAVQWAAGPATAQIEVAAMREHGLTNQAHFVETAEGLAVQRAKFAWYDAAGALGPDMLFGHFVHPTDHMVDRAVATGCGVVWQPVSNGRLGSGVADVVRYRRAGLRVGIGLDDQSCTDISDPFAAMRHGLYSQRALHHDAAVLTPADVLRMHTLGAAEVLGVDDRVGSLEVGKYADFVVVDHRAPATGPVWDVLATYVLACGLRNLKQVYVGGRLASADGRCTAPRAAEADGQLADRIVRAAAAAGMTPELA